MSHAHSFVRQTLIGAAAGLAGTAVMFGMRSFDQQYAPATVPKANEDPGRFIVRRGEHAAGLQLSDEVESGLALSSHFAYGSLFGLLFALLRLNDSNRHHHPFLSGGLLGVFVWAVGYLGWLPVLKLVRPAWKQTFPERAGELTRHIAYGVATAAAYGAISDVV